MARKKTLQCRYEGCTHRGFTSRAGRLYHERTKHGRAFLEKETPNDALEVKDTPTVENPKPAPKTGLPRQDTFVKITDVKFSMAKNTKKPKDSGDDYENECGKCGHEFNGTSKYCPDCGVEFA